MSHELRTPLTSIRLLIESLRDGRLEAGDREQVLSLLGRETDRLDALVERVLELSRLQSSHVYRREAIDAAALLEESVAAFDALTLTRPTPIARSVEPGLTLTGDRPTLVRALVNLLTNAWKYTGEDKRIELEARSAGRWLELIVRDNGVGIDPAEQRAIFEQFTRGRAALRGRRQGHGPGPVVRARDRARPPRQDRRRLGARPHRAADPAQAAAPAPGRGARRCSRPRQAAPTRQAAP